MRHTHILLHTHTHAVPVFKDLADNVVARIAGTLEVEDFSPGDDVVTQGDKGDKFFIIETGHVDVIRYVFVLYVLIYMYIYMYAMFVYHLTYVYA
jgi:signal-transduction protein with cAMP-binding, CBS, and nucleotidyltransferase domain